MDAGQVETVQATLPGYEATSSLAATFRSVYSPKEPAGFSKVAGLVRSRSLAEADGASARLETIRLWTRGVSTLRKRQAEQLAAEKLGWPYPPLIGGKRPDEIIRIYLYGEYLHWDQARGADQLASWQADPFSEAFFRMQFLQAVTPLAYLYIGFRRCSNAQTGISSRPCKGDRQGRRPSSSNRAPPARCMTDPRDRRCPARGPRRHRPGELRLLWPFRGSRVVCGAVAGSSRCLEPFVVVAECLCPERGLDCRGDRLFKGRRDRTSLVWEPVSSFVGPERSEVPPMPAGARFCPEDVE